jgi:cysteine desulfurase
MTSRILKEIEQSSLNGPNPGPKRLCNNINVTFKYIEGEALLTLLDDVGIAVSTASACGVNTLTPSHVLTAIGRTHADANSTVRMAIGKDTTKEEADYAIDELKKAVAKLRKISPFGR